MKKTVIASLFFIVCLPSFILSEEHYGSVVVSQVVSVYDGDTLKVNIDNYPAIIGQKISVRVYGIDTPEIKGKCLKEKELAQKAKKIATTMLMGAKTVELRNIQRDKYFRILSDVYANGQSLALKLIEENVAVAYDGGTKTKNWCE